MAESSRTTASMARRLIVPVEAIPAEASPCKRLLFRLWQMVVKRQPSAASGHSQKQLLRRRRRSAYSDIFQRDSLPARRSRAAGKYPTRSARGRPNSLHCPTRYRHLRCAARGRASIVVLIVPVFVVIVFIVVEIVLVVILFLVILVVIDFFPVAFQLLV